jgi:WXG100 family type VII secretion target
MEGILKVSPEQLTSAATEFSACGTTVRNITAAMTDIVTGLSSVWTGEDASAYSAKFGGLQDDIDRMHAMIQEHVTDLNEMARLYSNATTSNVTEIEALSSDVIV